MEILDSKYVDVKIAEGKVIVELPLIELLKQLAAKSKTKIDDNIIEALAKALG